MRPRRTAPLALAMLLIAAAGLPGGASAAEPVPASQTLSAGWTFHADGADRGMGARWYESSGAPEADWRAVRVPGVIDGTPRKDEFGGTIGWFRTTFTGPDAAEGFAWALRFQQVRRKARIWLNGREIGAHADPYVPFELAATGLRAGEPNTLVVRVDTRKGKEPREGWWNWGGITRGVTLEPRGSLVLQDPGVMPQLSCSGPSRCAGGVLVDATVVNRTDRARPDGRLQLTLTPPGGGTPITAAKAVRPLAAGEVARVRFTVPVPDAKLWSPSDPQRYGSTLALDDGGAVQQRDVRRIGLRAVAVEGGMLRLNGRQLALRGASIQEDVPGRGPAMTDADIKGIIDGLKALGANVTRAHYGLDERLMDALDAAGIMLWSQAPVYHRDRLLETGDQRAEALATLRGTILGNRNHPSVITHSVANELSVVPDEPEAVGTRLYLDAARGVVADLDPTVPASADLLSYPGYPRQETYARFPLLGINSYFGWYRGRKDHPTGNIDDLGPYLDKMRRAYPDSGLVVTEFGAESTFDGPADVKETFAFQQQYIQKVLDQIAARPFVGGAIYWTLREFAVKPNWDGGAERKGVERDAIHNKALLTYDGKRKPAWFTAEQEFTNTSLYRSITPAAAAGLPDGSPAGSPLMVVAFTLLVGGLLALDGWALSGILRARRPEDALPPHLHPQVQPEEEREPVGATA